MLNFYVWLCIGQKAEKKDATKFGEANLQPLRGRPMFEHLLITSVPNNKPKMLKVGPSFFSLDSKCKTHLRILFSFSFFFLAILTSYDEKKKNERHFKKWNACNSQHFICWWITLCLDLL
jgi:hypothetical protein